MSTTIPIVQYLWDSPQLVECFKEYALERGEPNPSFHQVVGDLTAAMSRNGIAWFYVVKTMDPEGAAMEMVHHTREDWDQVVLVMIQNIADKQAERLLGDL